ncbi:MAG: 2TM domain-containing protein [Bacteroidetes bacterium]|nr:2TM domain-containing protein [Bacteroidota bacterium]
MSHQFEPAPEGKDPELWELAQKRADLKDHLVAYILLNGMMWIFWCLTSFHSGAGLLDAWPIWSTAGWGIWLAFEFAEAYIFTQSNSTEKEYRKLKNQLNK